MKIQFTILLKACSKKVSTVVKQWKFILTKKLSFINSFHFFNSSLDSLVKNFSKDDFMYLSQELDSNVLGLVN